MVNFGAKPVSSIERKFVTVTNVSGGPLLVAVTRVQAPDEFSAGGGLPGTGAHRPTGAPRRSESCMQFVGFVGTLPGQPETGYLHVTGYHPLSGENLEEDFVALKSIPR